MSQTLKPIVDIRVIQNLVWVKDAGAGWIQVPAAFYLEYQRQDSDEWEKLNIDLVDVPNPEKDAEDAAGREAVDRSEVCDGRPAEE